MFLKSNIVIDNICEFRKEVMILVNFFNTSLDNFVQTIEAQSDEEYEVSKKNNN